MLPTVQLTIIAGGSVVGLILVVFFVYVVVQRTCRKTNTDAQGEQAYLLGYGSGPRGRGREWPHGDLDAKGVRLVMKWRSEIVPSGEQDDGVVQSWRSSYAGLESNLLGEDDGMVSPASGYSPRVSNISQMGSSQCRSEELIYQEENGYCQ